MAAFKDLTGQPFGKLTVIARSPKKNPKGPVWMCKCECGNETEARGDHLTSGKRVSCGCTRKFIFEGTKRFGRLVTVAIAPKGIGNRTMWLCHCDCGKVKPVSANHLQAGAVLSCGCLRVDTSRASLKGKPGTTVLNLTHQRFGKLVAKRLRPEKIGGSNTWECECDCGNVKVVAVSNLRSGTVLSCGCAKVNGEVVRPPELRKLMRGYEKTRYATDPQFNLEKRVRAAFIASLKRKGLKKSCKTTEIFEVLGYTIEELKGRLRATMPSGFTWDDFITGVLHIDHDLALKHFIYTSIHDDSFKKAWALGNLQLLTGEENMRKGAKLDWKKVSRPQPQQSVEIGNHAMSVAFAPDDREPTVNKGDDVTVLGMQN